MDNAVTDKVERTRKALHRLAYEEMETRNYRTARIITEYLEEANPSSLRRLFEIIYGESPE